MATTAESLSGLMADADAAATTAAAADATDAGAANIAADAAAGIWFFLNCFHTFSFSPSLVRHAGDGPFGAAAS